MAAQYKPKTLAKTLSYMVYHSPAEYGLFWDPDGTMPWKELYWALQEDASLRFVRESHLREILYLGIQIPVRIEGNLLRLQSGLQVPEYAVAERPPDRLYYACRRKHYPVVLEHGLTAANRPYLPLASEKELALRLGRRRDLEPVLIEVLTAKAVAEGIPFREAGPELYLVESLPVETLICPPIRAEALANSEAKKKRQKPVGKPETPVTPGSFFVDSARFHDASQGGGGAASGKGKKKGRKGADWKREARKDRNKRSL